jgi:hypothetical protein
MNERCPICDTVMIPIGGYYPRWVWLVAILCFPLGLFAFLAGREPYSFFCDFCGIMYSEVTWRITYANR